MAAVIESVSTVVLSALVRVLTAEALWWYSSVRPAARTATPEEQLRCSSARCHLHSAPASDGA